MRLGQLFAASGEIRGDLYGRGLWEADDGEMLERLDNSNAISKVALGI